TSIARFTNTSDNLSKALKATFLNENGKEQFPIVGSHSLGISRIMNVIADLHYDEKGIIWPTEIAPFKVIITIVNTKVEEQNNLAFKIYDELKSNGIEVLLDDRDERAGVKFNDRDLIGIPYRITVGKGAPEEIVEFSLRNEMINYNITATEALDKILG
ncbi:MAG: His/Gly/Thr/Pro-type tRNA ligase C-terminal domain-containing protein, partial [Clostridiaceae bacterium]